MASLFDRYEPFIAWRYLYRRRRGTTVLLLTLLFGLLSAIALATVFATHGRVQVIATSVSLPAMILFLFFLLLNLFSGFTAVSPSSAMTTTLAPRALIS